MPRLLEKYIANQIEIPPGIAKNRALLENIFTLFVCINNYVPVFVCGKPGCSKSLSFQLLYNSMKGNSSENTFFKKFPKLYVTSYQGSSTSTSKGVLKVFEKARELVVKNKKKENKENMISVLYFDLMGLAELSPNNPLKVIHSQLEFDEQQDKISFVGISNWKLDALKMNRGISLSIPDLDENNLKETGKIIIQSINGEEDGNKHETLINNLATTYHEYKQYLEQFHHNKRDYHGTRDFYNLIKNVSYSLKKKKEKKSYFDEHLVNSIGLGGLERNFGGLDFSIGEIKKKFFQINGNKEFKSTSDYEVMNLIKENLQEEESRYLLVISKSSISQYLIGSILQDLKKKSSFFIGSQFEKDTNSEFYSGKLLNKIQLTMEQEQILILKSLEYIYPSLYDLFNQNFTKSGEKQFAKIALGYSNNVLSEVNKKFKCIVLVDQNEIDKQEPPFLNRFEKHIVSIEYLLKEQYLNKSKEIEQVISDILTPKKQNQVIEIDIRKQLINCDEEEIKALVYQYKAEYDPQQMPSQVLGKISQTFSQDIIAFGKYSELAKNNLQLYQYIVESYSKVEHSNLNKYLSQIKNRKNIIYTFSNILDPIKIDETNSTFGAIKKEKTKEVLVSKINEEIELDKEIDEFYRNSNLNLCIFKFQIWDCIHLNHIKYCIDNKENYLNDDEKNKVVIFIIYLTRIFTENLDDSKSYCINHEHLISNLAPYDQIFIDNLKGDGTKINEIIDYSNSKLFETLLNCDQYVKEDFSFQSNILSYKSKFDPNQYNNMLAYNTIPNEEDLRKDIIKSILSYIEKMPPIIYSIFNNSTSSFRQNDSDLISIIREYQKKLFKSLLKKFVVTTERKGILNVFVNSYNSKIIKDEDKNLIKEIWKRSIIDINLDEYLLEFPKNEISYVPGLLIPGSYGDFETVIKYVREIIKEYLKNENILRQSDGEDPDLLKQYENTNIQLQNKVYEEMNKQKSLNYLIEENKKNPISKDFLDLLLKDYIRIVLEKQFSEKFDIWDLERLFYGIFKKKFTEDKNYFLVLANIILWMESYSKYINIICMIYNKVNIIIPHFYDKVLFTIEQNQIIIEESPRNPKTKILVNETFFYLLEGILYQLLRKKEKFNEENDEFFLYFDTIKSCIQLANQVESSLNVYLKELYTLDSFIQVYDLIMRIEGNRINQIEKYINIILEEADELKKNDPDSGKLFSIFEKEYNFLELLLGKMPEYPNLMISIFENKYKKITNKSYRDKWLDLLLNNDKLVQNSKNLLFFLLQGKNLSPDYDYPEDFLAFASIEDSLLDKIDKSNNQIIDQIILYYFDSQITEYFLKLKDKLDIEYLELSIFKDLSNEKPTSMKFFEQSIKFLETYEQEKSNYTLPHLGFLYSVSYIKYYLMLYVNAIFSKKQQCDNKNKIEQVIQENPKNNIKITMKIFILKLFCQKLKNYEDLKGYDWTHHGINWISDFSFREKNEESFSFTYF